MEKSYSKGLAGVIADESSISSIDGERGELRYRGYSIEDLAAKASFVQALGLVVDGEIPDARGTQQIEEMLRDRMLPPNLLTWLGCLPRETHPMAVLQAALPLFDRAVSAPSRDRVGQRRVLFGLAARIPTLAAAWARVRKGESPLPPDPSLRFHEDFLRMLRGSKPEPKEVQVLDVTQILQMEHSFNASTFAGRVVASTQAPLAAVLSACVGALRGPLHGGADEAAYRMALSIGDPDRAEGWVDEVLAKGEKIMGLGHREYRVVDPRARILQPLALELAELRGLGRVVRTLVAVDRHAEKRFAEKGKAIRANVEFYKGAVFAALGIEPDFFTVLFAMSRAWGWGAHAIELWDDPKLYRPQAEYVGAAPRTL